MIQNMGWQMTEWQMKHNPPNTKYTTTKYQIHPSNMLTHQKKTCVRWGKKRGKRINERAKERTNEWTNERTNKRTTGFY